MPVLQAEIFRGQPDRLFRLESLLIGLQILGLGVLPGLHFDGENGTLPLDQEVDLISPRSAVQ